MRRSLLPFFVAAVAAAPAYAGPLPPEPPPGELFVSGTLRIDKYPLVGNTVVVSAADVQINVGSDTFGLPSFAWTLRKQPAGSSALLVGEGTSRSIAIDRPGVYSVEMVVCPQGCSLPWEGKTLKVPAHTLVNTFDAKVEMAAPPAMEPLTSVLSLPATSPESFALEHGGICPRVPWLAGYTSANWVTTAAVNGPADLRLVEGTVVATKIAGNDGILSHYSHDWATEVRPDPAYRKLLNANANDEEIEIEWERDVYPEAFRPQLGDRISAFGFHAFDCGHIGGEPYDLPYHFNTEIHPPVLTAVHRVRAIELPSNQRMDLDRDGAANETVGKGVWVPGVVTDVWVNARGGLATSGSPLGLVRQTGAWLPTGAIPRPVTIPTPTPSIKRAYTFHIHLPKSPQAVARMLGHANPKPATLYFAVRRHPAAPEVEMGPMPEIVPVRKGDNAYLRVTLDLSNFGGEKLAQRIEAGWVYPSPDNWGLEQWQVQVPMIRVKSDSEWNAGGANDADWRLWLGIGSLNNPWTRVFDCNGCVSSSTDYPAGKYPWRAGATGSLGHLYGYVPLFPQQHLRLYATGFEADWIGSDGLPKINASLTKQDGAVGAHENGNYKVHWRVGRMPSPAPELEPAARAVFEAYKLRPSQAPAVEYTPIANRMRKKRVVSPDALFMLDRAPASELAKAMASVPPADLDETLLALRSRIDTELAKNPGSRPALLKELSVLRDMTAKDAWNARFGTLLPKP